ACSYFETPTTRAILPPAACAATNDAAKDKIARNMDRNTSSPESSLGAPPTGRYPYLDRTSTGWIAPALRLARLCAPAGCGLKRLPQCLQVVVIVLMASVTIDAGVTESNPGRPPGRLGLGGLLDRVDELTPLRQGVAFLQELAACLGDIVGLGSAAHVGEELGCGLAPLRQAVAFLQELAAPIGDLLAHPLGKIHRSLLSEPSPNARRSARPGPEENACWELSASIFYMPGRIRERRSALSSWRRPARPAPLSLHPLGQAAPLSFQNAKPALIHPLFRKMLQFLGGAHAHATRSSQHHARRRRGSCARNAAPAMGDRSGLAAGPQQGRGQAVQGAAGHPGRGAHREGGIGVELQASPRRARTS